MVCTTLSHLDMSFRQENTTQAKRFACDRCHDQKLRCPRPVNGGNATVPCIRCQRAGTVCNISSPLKTGRPSKAFKLQARTGQRSSSISPSLSRTSSNNTTTSQIPETSGTLVSGHRPDNGTYPFQDLDSTFINYASDVSSQHESFQICSQGPTHSVNREHSKHPNFDFEITSPMDMNSSDAPGRRDACKLKPCRYRNMRYQISCSNLAKSRGMYLTTVLSYHEVDIS